jgi:hypothetical protein
VAAPPGDNRGHDDVVQRGQLGQEQVVLEDESDVRAAERRLVPLGQRVRIATVNLNRARRWWFEHAQQIQQRALTAAGGSHDCDGLAAVERQRHALEDWDRPTRRVVVL